MNKKISTIKATESNKHIILKNINWKGTANMTMLFLNLKKKSARYMDI